MHLNRFLEASDILSQSPVYNRLPENEKFENVNKLASAMSDIEDVAEIETEFLDFED